MAHASLCVPLLPACPVEAVKMTESQVEAISPLAEDGSFKAGMKDVMSVLDATCEANVLQALEEQANLYLAAMDDPSVQVPTHLLLPPLCPFSLTYFA